MHKRSKLELRCEFLPIPEIKVEVSAVVDCLHPARPYKRFNYSAPMAQERLLEHRVGGIIWLITMVFHIPRVWQPTRSFILHNVLQPLRVGIHLPLQRNCLLKLVLIVYIRNLLVRAPPIQQYVRHRMLPIGQQGHLLVGRFLWLVLKGLQLHKRWFLVLGRLPLLSREESGGDVHTREHCLEEVRLRVGEGRGGVDLGAEITGENVLYPAGFADVTRGDGW